MYSRYFHGIRRGKKHKQESNIVKIKKRFRASIYLNTQETNIN